jgi:hypothetical protein
MDLIRQCFRNCDVNVSSLDSFGAIVHPQAKLLDQFCKERGSPVFFNETLFGPTFVLVQSVICCGFRTNNTETRGLKKHMIQSGPKRNFSNGDLWGKSERLMMAVARWWAGGFISPKRCAGDLSNCLCWLTERPRSVIDPTQRSLAGSPSGGAAPTAGSLDHRRPD